MRRIVIATLLSLFLHGLVGFWVSLSGVALGVGALRDFYSPIRAELRSSPLPPPQDNVIQEHFGELRSNRELAQERRPASGYVEAEQVIPLPGPPRFYSFTELDKAPMPFRELPTDLGALSSLGGEGHLAVSLWISSFGEVIKVQVDSADFPDGVTDAVHDYFRRLRFSPGIRNGIPVNAFVRIEMWSEKFSAEQQGAGTPR